MREDKRGRQRRREVGRYNTVNVNEREKRKTERVMTNGWGGERVIYTARKILFDVTKREKQRK